MGNERSAFRAGNPFCALVLVSKWKGRLSKVGASVSSWCSGTFQMTGKCVGQRPRVAEGRAEARSTGWHFPRSVSLFFPVFPYRSRHLDEEFQDIEIIAKGSLGPILKARQRMDEKIYAVKVMLKVEVIRQGILQQCKDGVVIQNVVHPFVQGLLECWQTSHLLLIKCDYQGAGDLHRLWVESKPLPESRMRVFAAELGSIIGFLHDSGIIHRDVKMENVLLNERGHIMLTDFGLSRRLQYGERALTICGTMQYMAPEVLRGSPYNHSADWWSLGVLLYTLVAGKYPVDPEVDHTLMLSKLERTRVDPPPVVSQSLGFLLSELLCEEPQRRLHRLDVFSEHRFFRGLSFDPELLQQLPIEAPDPGHLPPPALYLADFDWEALRDEGLPQAG
ncbi:ribosomal protein S6 kinase-related protein isoform X2 [Narcine bancroftii]|uniref:ribosomal protein S6 kinase-related protein isoform X2 n=1 Tax=Narcine bancroftii TaxID=1343680 RepID=UPI003831BEB5